MNKYEVKIVNTLLKKYYKRKAIHKEEEIAQRINLPIHKILKDYSDFNVDLNKKESVNKAIRTLEERGFIQTTKLQFSEDYEKVYLSITHIDQLEEYAYKHLDITPRSFAIDQLRVVLKKYKNQGKITDYYIQVLEDTIKNRYISIDVDKEEDLLNILCFLENNQEFLYIREASLFIFGDSKYFEMNRKHQVLSILVNYFNQINEDVLDDENLLERFFVFDTEQEICIKGDIWIEMEDRIVDIRGLKGGLSFSVKDLDKIHKIHVDSKKVMTIENKTSFLRMNQDYCFIYLGGFATKNEIMFIKKVIQDNPDKEYIHFGDIDAGGFWIHKKLCEQTNRRFDLFHMGVDDLKNPKYEKCIRTLSNRDRKRLESLKAFKEYTDCIDYMLQTNKKLEQEIISYHLGDED